jgi:hypothetical protein
MEQNASKKKLSHIKCIHVVLAYWEVMEIFFFSNFEVINSVNV